MNLLKVLVLGIVAASLALFLCPATAHAVDHPWDDQTIDSSHSCGAINNGNNAGDNPLKPYIDGPIIQRLLDWARGWIRDVKQLFDSGTQDAGEHRVDNSAKRPTSPSAYRKYK